MQARLQFMLLLLPYCSVTVSSSEESVVSPLEAGPSMYDSFLDTLGYAGLKRSRNPTNDEERTFHQSFDPSALAIPMRDRNVRLDQERRGSKRSKPIIIDDSDTETEITEPINPRVNREEECTTSAPNTRLTLFTGTPPTNPVGLAADISHRPGPPQLHPDYSIEFLEKFALPRYDGASLLGDHSGYPRIAEVGGGAIDTTAGSRTGNHLISQVNPSKSRGERTLSEYYPFQILEWIPPRFETKAALATQHMVNEFLSALPAGPSRTWIMRMNTSHRIIIPFVYKLMMKPLEIQHWSRILLVWRNMWSKLEGLDRSKNELEPSAHTILTRFLWISDFISESTIPQLIKVPNWKTPVSRSYIASPATRIINFLSGVEIADQLDGIQMRALMSLVQILNEELDAIGMRDLVGYKYSDTIPLLILQELNSKGSSIQRTTNIETWMVSYHNILRSSHDSWKSFKKCPIRLEDRIRSIFNDQRFNQKKFASELASNPTFTHPISNAQCNQVLTERYSKSFNPEKDVIYPQVIHNLFAQICSE